MKISRFNSSQLVKAAGVGFLLSLMTACSSSDAPAPAPETPSGGAGVAASESRTESTVVKREAQFKGRLQDVTTTLGNEEAIEGSIPGNMLSQVAMSLDDLARKDYDNVPLLVTYMSVLRLYGQNPSLHQSIEAKAGLYGAKNIWFMLEASYAALRRRSFSLADYLLTKAMQNAKAPGEKQAVIHAQGVKLLLQNKIQAGVAKMREAAMANPPFLPSALTVGFLALRAGDYVGAEKMFRIVTSSHPNSANGMLGLGISLRSQGKSGEAIPILQSVYRTKPNDRRVAWNLAVALSEKGESQQEAIGVLKRYFEMPGTFPEIDRKANMLMAKLNRPVSVSGPAGSDPAGGNPPAK